MIGERLAEVRKNKGMTQLELSRLVFVSLTTISGYENDHCTPSDDIKVKLAKIFNISLDYLLGAIDEELELNRNNTVVLPEGLQARILKDIEELEVFAILNQNTIQSKRNNRATPKN